MLCAPYQINFPSLLLSLDHTVPKILHPALESKTKIVFVLVCSSIRIKGLLSSFYSYTPNVKAAVGRVPARLGCTRASYCMLKGAEGDHILGLNLTINKIGRWTGQSLQGLPVLKF